MLHVVPGLSLASAREPIVIQNHDVDHVTRFSHALTCSQYTSASAFPHFLPFGQISPSPRSSKLPGLPGYFQASRLPGFQASMGNSSSNAGGGSLRPHGKRTTAAEKRAKQQAAGLPPVGAPVPAAPTTASASRNAQAAAPPAPAPGSANGQRRANPQARERKPFKELVSAMRRQIEGESGLSSYSRAGGV